MDKLGAVKLYGDSFTCIKVHLILVGCSAHFQNYNNCWKAQSLVWVALQHHRSYWLQSLQMCLIFHALDRYYHISHVYVHSTSCRSVNKYSHRISTLVVLRTIIINKQCTIHSPNNNNSNSRLQPDHCILDNTTLGYVDGIKHRFQNVHFIWWVREIFVYKWCIRNYVKDFEYVTTAVVR